MSELVVTSDDEVFDMIDEVKGFQLRQIIKREIMQNADKVDIWKGAYISAMYPLIADVIPIVSVEDAGRISQKVVRFGGFCQAIMKFSTEHMEEIISSALVGKGKDYYVDNSPGYYAISLKSRIKEGIVYLYGACSECGPDAKLLRTVTDVNISI